MEIAPGISSERELIEMIESILSMLGFGGSALAVSLIMGALWIWRGARILSIIGALFSSAVTIAVSLFVVLGISVALGWIDLSISSILSDSWGAISWMLDSGIGTIRELISILR
jgi:hypothetical protein